MRFDLPVVDRLGHWIIAHRLASVGIIAVALVAAAFAVATRGVKADFSPQALFTTFADQAEIDADFGAAFGQTENVAMVMIGADDVLDPAVLQYVHDLSRAFEQPRRPWLDRFESLTTTALPRADGPGVLRVDSPIRGDTVEPEEAAEIRAALDRSTLLDGTLVAESRHLTVVALFIGADFEAIAQLREVMAEIHDVVGAHPPPSGVTVEVGGIPHIRDHVVDLMLSDQVRLIPFAVVACAVLLLLAFRWWPGVVAPNVAVGLTAALLIGGMAAVDEPFNIMNQMLPTLLIIIGVSDSIHLISRFGEEFHKSGDRRTAARETVRTMLVACFLTSFTTAVGFASLLISRTDILRRFGLAAAAGILIAYVVTVLFLPPALSWAPKPSRTLETHTEGRLERVLIALVDRILKAPRTVLALSMVPILGAVALASTVTIDTTLLETFPEDTPIHRQVKTLEAELDGVLPFEVYLRADAAGRFDDPDVLNRVDRLADWVRDQPHVLSVTTYGDVLHEAWVAWADDDAKRDEAFANEAQVAQLASLLEGGSSDPIRPYVTPDRRQLRVNVQLADAGSKAARAFADRLLAEVDATFDGVDDLRVDLSGDAWSGSRGLDSLIHDMLGSIGMAFIIIFAFMTLLFSSLRMGMISIPPNVLPLLFTLAWMGLHGVFLNTTTVIIFSISIGLAVDDTIHMLARFDEEMARGVGLDEALRRAAAGSGRAIVITSVMLVGGLAVMSTSSFVPIRLFAELTGITILGCLFGDLIVLPALLKLGWRPNRRHRSATPHGPDGATTDAATRGESG